MLSRDPLARPEPLIRRVYSYVAYRIGDGPEAEDVTSATFERAVRYRSSFDRRKGEPVAWLLGIARRELAERAAARTDVLWDEIEVESSQNLERESVERLDVRRAMAMLDARDRELLALRYGADLTARQIAELLDERTNTVEVALHRALRRMRALLDPPREAPSAAQGVEAVRI